MLRSLVDALEAPKLLPFPPALAIDAGSSERSRMSYPAVLQMSPAAAKHLSQPRAKPLQFRV